MAVKQYKKNCHVKSALHFWSVLQIRILLDVGAFQYFWKFVKIRHNCTKKSFNTVSFLSTFFVFHVNNSFLQQDSTWSPINFSSIFSPKELGTVIITSLYRTDLFVRVLSSVVFECFYYMPVWCRVANLHNKK